MAAVAQQRAQPWGFLGYWGTSPVPQQQLQSIIARGPAPSLKSHFHSGSLADAGLAWGAVQFYDRATEPSTGSPLVALSAAGLEQPETWVDVTAEGELIWWRDVFGRVPLHWLQQGTVLWFASRLQLLLPLVDRPAVSLPALYGYSCFSYVPTPLTPIQGIHAVPAGVQQRHRWSPTGALLTETTPAAPWRVSDPPLRQEAAAIEQLQTLLQQAVERQLSALPKGPVGVLLSGGLDSSIVAALLVQAGVEVRAYSLDLGREEVSELPYARQVAEFLGIPLVTVRATPDRIRSALGATARALDLPFGDGVTVPLYLLNQAAAADTSVIFNGENGDQLFAGWTNKPLIAAGLYQTAVPTAANGFNQQYLQTFHRLWGYEAQVFTAMARSQIAPLNPADWLQGALGQASEPLLHRLRRATLMLKGAQNIQPRATQIAHAHGLQVRSPFCDPDLTRWTFSLSSDLYLRGTCEKYILKQAVAPWLPPEIVWRQKRGMGVPLTYWCYHDLWSDLGRWLNPARLRREGLWQARLPAYIAAGQLGGIQGRRVGELLWLLVMWQQWRQAVLGEAPPSRTWDHPFWLPPELWQILRRQLWSSP